MASEEENINPYLLLKLETEATEQEIKTAYRKLSLKVHPDRVSSTMPTSTNLVSSPLRTHVSNIYHKNSFLQNPDNPEAARLFHELNQAYELLLDPLRRLALDQKLRVKKARAERYKTYDAKRKNMVEELEERERAFKKTRLDKKNEEVKVQMETDRIKEEGRRMREQKEEQIRMRDEEIMKGEAVEEDDAEAPELRMFWSLHSDDLWLNCFIRPSRYHHSTKIFTKDPSRVDHTGINSQSVIRFRRSGCGIDRSFPQSTEKERRQTSQKRDSSGTFQTNTRCLLCSVCQWEKRPWIGGYRSRLGERERASDSRLVEENGQAGQFFTDKRVVASQWGIWYSGRAPAKSIGRQLRIFVVPVDIRGSDYF
jgi:curved DNA-binding protein CbpA